MPDRFDRWEALCLFCLGGSGYCCVEAAWRGFTHWTMFLVGGAALCWLAFLERRPGARLWAAALLGAGGVTALELLAGVFCTGVLHRRVWDYRAEWGDLYGYICPKYSLLWLALCAWVLAALRGARRAAHRT